MLSTTTFTHMLKYRILYYHVGLRRPEVDVEHHYSHTYCMLKYRILYYHVGLRRPEVDVEHHYSHTYCMLKYRILYYHVGLRRLEVDVEHHYSHTYAAVQGILSSRKCDFIPLQFQVSGFLGFE